MKFRMYDPWEDIVFGVGDEERARTIALEAAREDRTSWSPPVPEERACQAWLLTIGPAIG